MAASNEPATLGDLSLHWWYDRAVEPFPRGILTAPLAGLEAKGVDPGLLRRLTAALVHDFSTDRKAWYVAFFDDPDPAAAIREVSMGCLLAAFYVDHAGQLLGYEIMKRGLVDR